MTILTLRLTNQERKSKMKPKIEIIKTEIVLSPLLMGERLVEVDK